MRTGAAFGFLVALQCVQGYRDLGIAAGGILFSTVFWGLVGHPWSRSQSDFSDAIRRRTDQ
jgi:hypothetical protein